MNNNVLKAFAKNGLEILQWSILLLLYEAEAKEQTLKLEDIRKSLNLPTSENSKPGGVNKNAFVREILRSSHKIDGYVECIARETWQLTSEGRRFVETGKKRYTQIC